MGFVTSAQRYDVLVVGDVATDVIIRLPDTRAKEILDDSGRWLAVPFGQKVPVEHDVTVAAGGSAANGAVALSRLGLRVGIATFLAHDHIGLDLLDALHIDHVDTRLVHVDAPAQTNRNYVLSLRGDRTIFVRDSEFNYHWPHLRPNEVPAWLYLTSLGRGALAYQDQIADWLEENPDVHLVVQPGTFQVEAGIERLQRLYRRAALFVCDYAQATALVGSSDDPTVLLDRLSPLGCESVVVTLEDGGAVARVGNRQLRIPPFPDSTPPFDRLGGPDAFAATVVAATVLGHKLDDAIRWGAVNFMSVSHELGSQAGLLTEEALRGYLEDVGDSFVASEG